jgi:hypothetical protein
MATLIADKIAAHWPIKMTLWGITFNLYLTVKEFLAILILVKEYSSMLNRRMLITPCLIYVYCFLPLVQILVIGYTHESALALVMSIYHTIMVIIDLTPSPVFLTTFIMALTKNDFGIESHIDFCKPY